MGKIRTRIIGLDDVEEKQKKDQKKRSEEKKTKEKPVEKQEESKEQKFQAEKTRAKKEQKTEKKARSRSKTYLEVKKLAGERKKHTLQEAIALLKEMKRSSFDETVELHINVDKTGLKGEIQLPHSIGKTVRVAVVNDALLEQIEKGIFDFDILVTHPSFMPKLAKFAKTLGPKGLMPNPKAGTISPNPDDIVKKFEKGLLRWKTEPKFPLIHQMIGKISFEENALIENGKAFLQIVGKAHIKKAFIKNTMSPSLQLDVESI